MQAPWRMGNRQIRDQHTVRAATLGEVETERAADQILDLAQVASPQQVCMPLTVIIHPY